MSLREQGATKKRDGPSTLKGFGDRHYLDVLVLLDGITRDWVGPGPHNCESKDPKKGSRQMIPHERADGRDR